MPFHPGILLSALLLILCLGVNLTQYPTVRGMLREPQRDTSVVPSTSTKQSAPASPQSKENSIPTKNSKVYKPIQSETPKIESPKVEPQKVESKKEPVKTELPKAEPQKIEPKKEPAKTEPPKIEQPKPETPKSEPAVEKPKEKEPVKVEPKVEPKKEVSPKSNPESAFLPVVPASLEQEYKNSKDQNINQFAMFAPQKTLPILKGNGMNNAMEPSQSAPVYAKAYQPPAIPQPKNTSNMATSTAPAPKPKAVWSTIDSALERPLMYESP